MRLFHSRIYATQLWRFVTGLLEHNGSVTKDLSVRVIVDQIAAFCTAFTDLRKDFDSRLSRSRALVLSQPRADIDAINEISAHLNSEATV